MCDILEHSWFTLINSIVLINGAVIQLDETFDWYLIIVHDEISLVQQMPLLDSFEFCNSCLSFKSKWVEEHMKRLFQSGNSCYSQQIDEMNKKLITVEYQWECERLILNCLSYWESKSLICLGTKERRIPTCSLAYSSNVCCLPFLSSFKILVVFIL